MVRHGNNKLKMASNNRLKAARVLKGMTQLQLADQVGLKEIEVSRIETGRWMRMRNSNDASRTC